MNKKIIDYKTLSASYPDELDIKINEAIKEGWQPYGYQIFHSAFHQPMVKYAKKYIYVVTKTLNELADIFNAPPQIIKEAVNKNGKLNGYPTDTWTTRTVRGDLSISIPKEEFSRIVEELGIE